MKKTIVLADRARLRVLQVEQDELEGSPAHLREVTDQVANEIPEQISDVVTDQQGRFGNSGRGGGADSGERHGLESEMDRQFLTHLAEQIDATVPGLLDDGGWVLAAPQAILKQLEQKLSPVVRERLINTVPGDLTKVPLKDLEKRFI